MPNHHEFLELGDEWLISYSHIIWNNPATTLFTIGHSLEAYCKGVLLKYDPTINIRSYSHDIQKMLEFINENIGLLNDIHFLPDIEEKYMIGGLIPMELTVKPDWIHYIQNQELYWVSKFQKDLKYLGTTGENMPTQFSLLVLIRNPYWIPILKTLRRYIKASDTEESFTISSYLQNNRNYDFAEKYIREICI